jgi:hypothetical protein
VPALLAGQLVPGHHHQERLAGAEYQVSASLENEMKKSENSRSLVPSTLEPGWNL